MLHVVVCALFDDGRWHKTITGSNNRSWKSLSDMLKASRDHSGLSVILVGPTPRLHPCGLLKKKAIDLIVFNKPDERGHVNSIKSVQKSVENERPEMWDIREDVIAEHPVMLNRAATLHRLVIQAIDPGLIEGNANQLDPLVCSAFNAYLDGDQVADRSRRASRPTWKRECS